MSLLTLRDVTRDYAVGSGLRQRKTLQAVRGIDLEIKNGEVLGLVGESGCGKSTLARLLLGIEPPSCGEIRVSGKTITDYSRLERAGLIQPVFQDPYSSLNPRMTVSAIIAAPLEVRDEGNRTSRELRVLEIMRAVGLPEHFSDFFPGQLSGGQRQRVALARALIGEPDILVCDEPTSALDVSVQSQVLNLIAKLRRKLNLTIILISHNLAVVHHLADRVAVMYLGKIVELGETEELFSKPRHPYTKALMDAVLTPESGLVLPDLDPGADMPSPVNPPAGCAFHPRCPKAFGPCSNLEPHPVNDQRGLIACHLHEPEIIRQT